MTDYLDKWESAPSAPQEPQGIAHADRWDAISTESPTTPKTKPAPQEPPSWFERQLAKLPEWTTGDIRPKIAETLASSGPGRAVMGALDTGTGMAQGAAHVTPGDAGPADQRIAQFQQAYEGTRQANEPQNLSGLVTGKKPEPGADWWRISGNVAGSLALPFKGAAEGANFINRLIYAGKTGAVAGAAQPVEDATNYWTEKAKQTGLGLVGSVVGQPVAEAGAKVIGTVANKVMNLFRRVPAEDATIAAVRNASPELKAAVVDAQKRGMTLDLTVLGRQVEADSLPVKMSLTPGQAKQDPILISTEMNMRGKNPELAYKYRDQNQHLIDNMNAIKSNVAPDAIHADHVAAGEHLISKIEAADTASQKNISALYQKLKDANGGKFPVDGIAFVDKADAALGSEMKSAFLPAQVRSIMDGFRDGKPMTYENFENLRTILASEGRKAARASDGNTEGAIATVRNALESLPMSGEAANVKPLADAARAAAKDRFDQIKEVPALRDVVAGKASADDFIRKHIVSADKKELQGLALTLKDDPVALQTIKGGVVDYLKKSAGIVNDNGNFSQAGYNKALEVIKPKLGVIFNKDEAHVLETVGNVARYTQMQPRGSFVNNSNTDVAAVARGALAHAADSATQTPVGSLVNRGVTSMLERKANQTRLGEILNPGAGVATAGTAERLLTQQFPLTAGKAAGVPLAAFLSQYPNAANKQSRKGQEK